VSLSPKQNFLVFIIFSELISIIKLPQLIGLLGTVSVVVFGALSGSRTWAHEWQFNDLSWAFAVAVIGVVLLHLAGVLFLIEACCQYKKKLKVSRGGYSFTTIGRAVTPLESSGKVKA